MHSDQNALLFCPPMAPVKLSTEHAATIGRQGICDLAIRQEDISRRHTEVHFEDGAFVVRDLGSTNGTFLNGREISGSERLSPGDRIEIGSCTITFCQIESTGLPGMGAAPDADKTIIAERLPLREAFSGDLAQIPPFAVMQMLEMGGKSGLLEIETSDERCNIWFREGEPIHAETEKLAGFDAALSIVNAASGSFRFDPQPNTQEPTIACTVTELLLEGCRRADEADQ
jgi:pSer/pThr/pTyr-binding forkhead associated (FHA) protein